MSSQLFLETDRCKVLEFSREGGDGGQKARLSDEAGGLPRVCRVRSVRSALVLKESSDTETAPELQHSVSAIRVGSNIIVAGTSRLQNNDSSGSQRRLCGASAVVTHETMVLRAYIFDQRRSNAAAMTGNKLTSSPNPANSGGILALKKAPIARCKDVVREAPCKVELNAADRFPTDVHHGEDPSREGHMRTTSAADCATFVPLCI